VEKVGKKPINQSLQKELSWYLSTLKYLQEGIEMVKEQREIIELPVDLSINLTPLKKKEDLIVVAREAELSNGIGNPYNTKHFSFSKTVQEENN
ncbi:MAG: hypothetical protein KAT03_01180, partial [Candidatus Heimdallarchaeota archaeon]|nr:hypothetical protein [Candidatus Heimdallarchaeota archaeon]